MLIDSGADLTLIPAILVDELECDVETEEGYDLEGFEGRKSLAKSVQLELKFLGRTFRGRFVILNSECGILGRNVLNHVALLLDGPHLSWQEQKDSSK